MQVFLGGSMWGLAGLDSASSPLRVFGSSAGSPSFFAGLDA